MKCFCGCGQKINRRPGLKSINHRAGTARDQIIEINAIVLRGMQHTEGFSPVGQACVVMGSEVLDDVKAVTHGETPVAPELSKRVDEFCWTANAMMGPGLSQGPIWWDAVRRGETDPFPVAPPALQQFIDDRVSRGA